MIKMTGMLKDNPHLFRGNARLFYSKYKISGLECRMRFKLVLAHTLDPFGPFWIAHPTKKYLHPKAQPAEICVEKNAYFGTSWSHFCLFFPIEISA